MWQHAIGQRFLGYITYGVAFSHFHASLIPFCTFIFASWLNLITHLLLSPIAHKLSGPIQSIMFGYQPVCSCTSAIYNNLHALASYLIHDAWLKWTSNHQWKMNGKWWGKNFLLGSGSLLDGQLLFFLIWFHLRNPLCKK
jgi:hypothetical protein